MNNAEWIFWEIWEYLLVFFIIFISRKIRDVLETCLKLMQSPGRIDIFLVFTKIAIGVGDGSWIHCLYSALLKWRDWTTWPKLGRHAAFAVLKTNNYFVLFSCLGQYQYLQSCSLHWWISWRGSLTKGNKWLAIIKALATAATLVLARAIIADKIVVKLKWHLFQIRRKIHLKMETIPERAPWSIGNPLRFRLENNKLLVLYISCQAIIFRFSWVLTLLSLENMASFSSKSFYSKEVVKILYINF